MFSSSCGYQDRELPPFCNCCITEDIGLCNLILWTASQHCTQLEDMVVVRKGISCNHDSWVESFLTKLTLHMGCSSYERQSWIPWYVLSGSELKNCIPLLLTDPALAVCAERNQCERIYQSCNLPRKGWGRTTQTFFRTLEQPLSCHYPHLLLKNLNQ